MFVKLSFCTVMLLALSAVGYGNSFPGCGKVSKRFRRIVGGRDSRFGHHPWQAALFKSNSDERPFCGGVLISDRTIITAAHCMKTSLGIESLTVRLGEYNVLKTGEELPHEVYKVEHAEIHPEYSHPEIRNDLALLKLDRIVRLNQHIVPVCLPPGEMNLIGLKATVSGWGRTNFYNITSHPAILNEVEVEVIATKVCQQWMTDQYQGIRLDDGQLCAGYENGSKSSCTNDSGGPLTIPIDDKRVLIGIVSWGISCNKKRNPGIYVNIVKYLPWIRATIDQQIKLGVTREEVNVI